MKATAPTGLGKMPALGSGLGPYSQFGPGGAEGHLGFGLSSQGCSGTLWASLQLLGTSFHYREAACPSLNSPGLLPGLAPRKGGSGREVTWAGP